MEYKYKPWKFYILVFVFTWFFWFFAAFVGRLENGETFAFIGMFLGLLAPTVLAIIFVFSSGSELVKKDFKRKLLASYRLKASSIIIAILGFVCVVVVSILISLLFGESTDQFAFTPDVSFSIYGASSLIVIIFASIIEELAWRGYGEDAVGFYHTWFVESIIFGTLWSLWHVPLFIIPGSYHYGLTELGWPYVLNFLLSVVPFGFLTTWVYLKNNRSMLACIIFHLFINFMQEKIALTPFTKCIESFVILLVAILIVLVEKKMFFDRSHIGRLLEDDKRLQEV